MLILGRKGKMIDHEIKSNYLQETKTIRIYLPESFSELNKYHLCIMQDGNDYYQMGRIATLSDKLHENRTIKPTVFAGIHYKDKYDRRKKYHPNGDQYKAYTAFLIHEVVPMLDQILPTYHLGQSRALIGDSLAGTLALLTAINYPNIFGKVIMQSPLVDDVVLAAAEQADDIQVVDMYHTIGEAEIKALLTDGKEMDFLTPNRQLKDILSLKGNSYYYKELPAGKHTWKYWQQDLPDALTKMFAP